MTNLCAALLATLLTCVASTPQLHLISKRAITMDQAQADFALNLLKTVSSSNETAILSPFSIAVALSMTYVGAEGKTKEQMTEVMAKGQDAEQLAKYFTTLLSDIANKAEGYTLDTANRLYTQKNFVLKQAYLDIIKAHYAGQLQQVDFSQGAAVAKEINDWVAKQTRDKIKNLVTADDITVDLRLALVNAIYFKGTWKNQFDKARTKKKPFYVNENEQKEVDMMSMKAYFRYYEDNEVQVLGMPFKGGEVHMIIVLPQERFGLAELEKKLTGAKLLEYFAQWSHTEVQVEVPKFKMEKRVQLVETLAKLGMTDAFSGAANFHGISDEELYISNVIHKAFIEVNEEGAEAAAASVVGMRLRSAPMMSAPEVRIFHADHPYLFVITRHNTSLLFIGRMV